MLTLNIPINNHQIFKFQSITQGSGLFGSIKSTDLGKASISSDKKTTIDGTRGDGFVDKPVTNVRKIIAQRLLESKQVGYKIIYCCHI